MSQTVTIPTLSGQDSFGAYVARPDGAPRAAIVVIQEIFGINAGIRRIVYEYPYPDELSRDLLAEAGVACECFAEIEND